MKRIAGIISVWLMLAVVCLAAEEKEEIIVSATRMATKAETVASSVTVITSRDIKASGKAMVLEVIKAVPGLHVVQNGGLGSSESIFIRGAEAEQVLVLVDGVELNDPMAAGRSAVLANMDVENIERIEILRGAQSCLYGSDAIAGVISITTKKGKGDTAGYVSAEAGSYNTFMESAGLSGKQGILDYSLSVSRLDSDGFSSAAEQYGNTEDDAYEHTSLSGRFGIEVAENMDLDLVLRYIDSENEYDSGAGAGGDAEGNVAKNERFIAAARLSSEHMDSLWQQSLGASLADHDRSYDDDWGSTVYDSQLYKVDWKNDLHLGEANVVTVGAEYEEEQGKTSSIDENSLYTASLYLQDQVKCSDSAYVTLGGRLDDREDYGSEFTYRIAPVYIVRASGTRLKATYATGFKTPSLYQLYAPASSWGNVGNPDLEPEESEGWDVGVEQEIAQGKATIGASYFDSEYKNLIDFENGFVNRDKVDISGVELFADYMINDDLVVAATYTYLDAKDMETGEQQIRRPENKVSANLNWQCTDAANLNVNVLYVGERNDSYYDSSMFASVDVDLDEYVLVNLAGTYDVTDNVQLLARVDNLLDEEYEEVAGYGTPGLSGYGGVKIAF
ncbi:hypothetical protein BVX94_03060 [bacterium B17]|nr:hypothetical protein BVX94_03060 [bacterium B17]